MLTLAGCADLGVDLGCEDKRVGVVALYVVWLSEHVREAEHDIDYDLEILWLAALDHVFIQASEDTHFGLAVAIPGVEVYCSDGLDGSVGGLF